MGLLISSSVAINLMMVRMAPVHGRKWKPFLFDQLVSSVHDCGRFWYFSDHTKRFVRVIVSSEFGVSHLWRNIIGNSHRFRHWYLLTRHWYLLPCSIFVRLDWCRKSWIDWCFRFRFGFGLSDKLSLLDLFCVQEEENISDAHVKVVGPWKRRSRRQFLNWLTTLLQK